MYDETRYDCTQLRKNDLTRKLLRLLLSYKKFVPEGYCFINVWFIPFDDSIYVVDYLILFVYRSSVHVR